MKILIVFSVLFATAIASSAQTQNVNFLIIMAEDINPDLGSYGNKHVFTPTLDSLAGAGVRYTNAFCTSAVCAPSRASIITGMYSTAIGTQHMRQAKSLTPYPGVPEYNAVPPPDVKAVTEYLRANNYFCTNRRKTDYQFGEPFTVWDMRSDTAHWRYAAKDQPFYSVFTFETTHEINVWPDSTKLRFFREFNVDTSRLFIDVKRRPHIPDKYVVNPESVVLPPYYPSDPIVREDYARYLTNITRLDTQVASLMKQLREDGLENNTIIIFLGDNGAGMPRAKRWMYDTGLKVPLIISIPEGLRKGIQGQLSGVDEKLVSMVDLAPTVVQLAGLNIPVKFHGQPFLMKSGIPQNRSYVYAGRDRMDDKYDLQRAVRSKRYKYIRNYWPDTLYTQPLDFQYQMPLMQRILELYKQGKLTPQQSYWLYNQKPEEELYDVLADPLEMANLARDPKYQKVLSEMRSELGKWQVTYGDWLDTPEIVQAEKMWPGGVRPKTIEPRLVRTNDNRYSVVSPTAGASIGYRFKGEVLWRLYSEPLALKSGQQVDFKSVRYGYAESAVVNLIVP